MNRSAKQNYLVNLRQMLNARFDEGELRTLCFDLSVEYDTLPGAGKQDKTRELIAYLDRHDRIDDLIIIGKQRRPEIIWDSLKILSEQSRIFISSCPKDKEFADIIAQTVSRITLSQVEVWDSSNITTASEIVPIAVWLDEIRVKLEQSSAIIVLLTPLSIHDQWVHFQSGLGAATPYCKMIPVGIGINCSREIPFPLAQYQSYQLSDYESMKQLVKKLVAECNINFDEEMARPVLSSAIKKIMQLSSTGDGEGPQERSISTADLLESVKQHIDRRFLELLDNRANFSTSNSGNQYEPTKEASYTIPIYLNFPDLQREQYLEITVDATVQDIYNRIYFMLENEVDVFTYLREWILRERNTGMYMIIKEVTNMIPARFLFTPETEWEAIKLKEPYSLITLDSLILMPVG